jgi:hypothetical protein
MALSPEERRFLKSWEEQRKGGKVSFVGVYTFGLFIMFSMGFLAIGLFSGWAFLKLRWLIIMAICALAGAFLVANLLWILQQKKFSSIVRRELADAEKPV